MFECKHKKVGTMVLYKHCDVLTVLSNTLAKRTAAQRREETSVRDITTQFEEKISMEKDLVSFQQTKLSSI